MNDKIIQSLIQKEEKRQSQTINLIASENYVSRDVREASASVFTNKYSEGYPGKRYYAGNTYVDDLERLTQDRARNVFGLSEKEWGVNVQALSGVAANMLTYAALVKPGDLLMAQALDQGGHLSHGAPVSLTSTFWQWMHYYVDKNTHTLDYEAIRKHARAEKPNAIIAGTSAYSRLLDFKAFRDIADDVGAYLIVDMAHIAGLVAAGVHPSPFSHADVVTTTTHKTLRGPRGALIFYRADLAKQINSTVFPGGQGGPHNHQTAAIAVALQEAQKESFVQYGKQVVKNAQLLAQSLSDAGFSIIAGGTDTHVCLIDIASSGIFGKEAQDILEAAGITVNRNAIPYDTRSPFDPSGIRIGTPSVTTRGMKDDEMQKIADMIAVLLKREKNPQSIKKDVYALCRNFPIPEAF